tara:strand:- start:2233 stop:2496 length:264 start_codon:yes stop_codon:yes gene_type:complete
MIRTDKLMTKTEIKFDAQMRLLDNGDGAFLAVEEDYIESLERRGEEGMATAADAIELANAKNVLAEMQIQFGRMMKLFGFTEFQGSH